MSLKDKLFIQMCLKLKEYVQCSGMEGIEGCYTRLKLKLLKESIYIRTNLISLAIKIIKYQFKVLLF